MGNIIRLQAHLEKLRVKPNFSRQSSEYIALLQHHIHGSRAIFLNSAGHDSIPELKFSGFGMSCKNVNYCHRRIEFLSKSITLYFARSRFYHFSIPLRNPKTLALTSSRDSRPQEKSSAVIRTLCFCRGVDKQKRNPMQKKKKLRLSTPRPLVL